LQTTQLNKSRSTKILDAVFILGGLVILILFTTVYLMPFRMDDVLHMDWAREHYDVLQRDPHRKVFLIERPEGMQALRQTLLAKEAVYYTGLLVKDANKKAKKSLEKSIRSYIQRETSWRPVRDEEVDFSLEIHFGQLYARLIYGRESVREKLDSLENSWKHVL